VRVVIIMSLSLAFLSQVNFHVTCITSHISF
jgi:hypothetical protein